MSTTPEGASEYIHGLLEPTLRELNHVCTLIQGGGVDLLGWNEYRRDYMVALLKGALGDGEIVLERLKTTQEMGGEQNTGG